MLSQQFTRENLSNLKIFAEKLCDLQDDGADWHLKGCRKGISIRWKKKDAHKCAILKRYFSVCERCRD